jgi:hypothetical protein
MIVSAASKQIRQALLGRIKGITGFGQVWVIYLKANFGVGLGRAEWSLRLGRVMF